MPLFQQIGCTQHQRKYLFFCICIWVRCFLAYSVYTGKVSHLCLVSTSLLSVLLLLYQQLHVVDKRVWWDRRTHCLSATLVLAAAVGNRTDLAGLVLLLDVAYGAATAVSLRPWDT